MEDFEGFRSVCTSNTHSIKYFTPFIINALTFLHTSVCLEVYIRNRVAFCLCFFFLSFFLSFSIKLRNFFCVFVRSIELSFSCFSLSPFHFFFLFFGFVISLWCLFVSLFSIVLVRSLVRSFVIDFCFSTFFLTCVLYFFYFFYLIMQFQKIKQIHKHMSAC